MFLTETWLTDQSDQAIISSITPAGYSMIHTPRANGARGGGVAVIYRQNMNVKLMKRHHATSFETTDSKVMHKSEVVRFLVIYRPPPS